MFTRSLWNEFSETTDFPVLDGDLTVDTVIIGGGITGLSVAREMLLDKHSAVVLEARKVGGGTTSHSTGNLYSVTDKSLQALLGKYNSTFVGAVVKARNAAVNRIEQNVQRFSIDCDFKRQPWYLFSVKESRDDFIEDELESAERISLDMDMATIDEIPYPATKAVKLDNQAQINPMLYVQGLAKKISSEDIPIFENSPVTQIEKNNDHYRVHTPGGIITTKNVVHATHTPKGIKFVQTLIGPYREYGIACKLRENMHPEGIYWGYFDKKEKISTRMYSRLGEDFLVVVGKPHKVGQTDSNVRHIKQLEEFAHHYFPGSEVMFRWGGQHYRPADLLPYIGRERKHSNIYLATGYSTDGLVYGTLAGIIISDQIAGKMNPWADLFDASRNQPLKTVNKFLKENLNVARQYFKNIPWTMEDEDFAAIAPGEGKVVEKKRKKIAVFKDEHGQIRLHSAVCPHMGCIVNWNNAENSWDCPCHASRFKPDGSVLEGPALHSLQPVQPEKEEGL